MNGTSLTAVGALALVLVACGGEANEGAPRPQPLSGIQGSGFRSAGIQGTGLHAQGIEGTGVRPRGIQGSGRNGIEGSGRARAQSEGEAGSGADD